MSRNIRSAGKAHGIARRALACMASVALVVGVVPGVALADEIEIGKQTEPVAVPYQGSNVVTIDGGVEVRGDGPANKAALDVGAPSNGGAAVTVKGDVVDERSTVSTQVPGLSAVYVSAKDQGVAEVVVEPGSAGTGKVAVTRPNDIAYGAYEYAVNSGAEYASSGKVSLKVGDVSAESGPYQAVGIYSYGQGRKSLEGDGAITLTVAAGNVTATSKTKAAGLYVYQSRSQVTSMVFCEGDVAAKVEEDGADDTTAAGIALRFYNTRDCKATVFVKGTVSAQGASNNAGVMLEGVVPSAELFGEGGGIDVTVWKIEAGEGGVLTAWNSYGGIVESPELAAAINYIVKVDGEVKNAILSAAGEHGKTRQQGETTYNVANKGERVYLTISGLQEGYRVLGAYNGIGEGRTALEFDKERGQYYYVVPNGGGVFLTADISNLYDITFANDDGTVLQKSQFAYGSTPTYDGVPTKEPTAESVYEFAGWKPVVNPVTGEAVYVATYTEKPREYSMSFDLGGGTVDGKPTYTVAAAYGSTITLPTPVREGYEFQYWEGSRYYGGDSYKVEGPHSFKAVWKEKEPAPGPEPEPSPEPESAPAEQKATLAAVSSDATSPRTGDGTPVAPALAALLASVCALGICCARTSRRPAGKHARR